MAINHPGKTQSRIEKGSGEGNRNTSGQGSHPREVTGKKRPELD